MSAHAKGAMVNLLLMWTRFADKQSSSKVHQSGTSLHGVLDSNLLPCVICHLAKSPFAYSLHYTPRHIQSLDTLLMACAAQCYSPFLAAAHSTASKNCALGQSKGKHTYAQPATQTQQLGPAAPLDHAIRVPQAVTAAVQCAMSTTEPASCWWSSCSAIRCCFRCCHCCCICDGGPESLQLHPQMPRHLLPWHEGPSGFHTLPVDQMHTTAGQDHVLAHGALAVAAAVAPSALLGFSPAA